MMRAARRTLFAVLIGGLLALPGVTVAQEKYPGKPITLMGGFPAGGWVDMTNRILAGALEPELGVPIVIRPAPGAGGAIASQKLSQTEPDGYTLMLQTTGTLFTRTRFQKLAYTYKDFTPIATIAASVSTISVRKDSKWKTLADFVKDAKANPSKYSFSSSGTGSLGHLAMVAVAQATGVQLKHVPFQGGPAAVSAVLGGHVDLVSGDNTNPEIRPLVTTHPTRTSYFPDTPTMKELGYDVEMVVRNMVIGPAKMPKERVQFLVEALGKAVKKQTYQGLMKGISMDLMFETNEQLSATWEKLDAKYEKLIEGLGLAYYQKK